MPKKKINSAKRIKSINVPCLVNPWPITGRILIARKLPEIKIIAGKKVNNVGISKIFIASLLAESPLEINWYEIKIANI